MALFWILAAAMTALALAFVLVPLLRTHEAGSPSGDEANLEVLRSQRREIDADVANGTLAREARDEALEDLLDRADEDLAPPPAAPARVERKPWIAAACAGVAIPAIAFGIYLAVGTPAAVDSRAGAAVALGDRQIVDMVEALARKVKERPDDAHGWELLARSMAALGRYPEASQAYAHLAALLPGEAQVLADYADALAMAQGRKLAGRPRELAQRALEIDPKHR
jgi:cytochrome c-type biogenesis protein CcmH